MEFRVPKWAGPLLLAGLAGLPSRAESPSPSADAAFAKALTLVERQESASDRLLPAAEATADALLAGHGYFLAGDPVWVGEGSNRAGGTVAAESLRDPAAAAVKAGDAVWLGYSGSNYRANLELGRRLEDRGALVVYFGPLAPPRVRPGLWIDSLTGAAAPDGAVLLGNILSLWSETGELAASLSRRRHTLAFYQSRVIYGSVEREKFYPEHVWHEGWPVVKPVPAGVLARAYLEQIAANLRQVEKESGARLAALGEEIARRAAARRPAILMADGGHVMPAVLSTHAGPYLYREAKRNAAAFQATLHPGDLVVFFGYVSIPRDLLGAIHRAGASAVWIVSPLPQDCDVTEFGDGLIDQGWTAGDAAVRLPGYDIRILPPSGVIELVILDSLR